MMVRGLSLLDETDAAWREEYRLSPVRRVAKVEEDCACEECILEGVFEDYHHYYRIRGSKDEIMIVKDKVEGRIKYMSGNDFF